MSNATAPIQPTTNTGNPLPLASLPQTELLTIHESEAEELTDILGEGIHARVLRLDLEHNEWVVLARFEPGSEIPLHYHSGPAEVFTLQGRWLYREYPDQPQTAGSYLYEPGGSVHTFYTPEDNTEDTVLLVRVSGANVNFNEDGSYHSILDAVSIRALAGAAAAERGASEPRYIGGGAADYTVDGAGAGA